MQLDSYAKVHNLFGKARNAVKGKPIGNNWRLFQDGDEYALYCYGVMFGRFLPNNTFRFCYDRTAYMPPAAYSAHKITPIMIVRRSKGHYRVHIKDWGTEVFPTAKEYNEFRTGGYKLYDGMVLDLSTRLMVRYMEPKLVVDDAARTKWLRQLRTLKRHLHTIAKLGGFTAMFEPIAASNEPRWAVGPNLLRPTSADLHTMSQALDGVDLPIFVEMVAKSMFINIYPRDDIPAQRHHIDAIFSTNSLELRRLRGVVEYK